MKWLKKWQTAVVLFCCALLHLFGDGAKAENGLYTQTSARAAVLIERSTGSVLLEHNADEPLPMASTTKVMTALLALENGDPDDMVTAGRNAYGVPGTSIYLGLGEQITLRDLLYGLMLASGNDAAVAIAEHIGGTVENFCQMMTQRAAELGCTSTVFLTPHGLPKNGHYTTAHDLALIAREAMNHPFFREIVSTQRASIPWEGRSYPRILNNKNKLLSSYEGATGIKTGYTKAAGRCLVFGACRDGMEVIGVVLNCADWFEEAARLMDQGFERYTLFTAFAEGETVRLIPLVDGQQQTVRIAAAQALAAPVPKGSVPQLELDLPQSIQAGAERGEAVGEARLTADGRLLASVPLILDETIPKRDYAFALEKITQHWLQIAE